ncbi:sulfatase family protein [Mariniblastus fucicola]|uniref:Arylsulfatase n=1 Tax=Mariniblastus fucicola TaxID=980251 RepID=A0A5B9PCC2_9BACT|nr:sulfatase [Mariniblastus fucicola]QEG22815.1 Arylsulfatase [Mariniblastus fucicola]
MIYKIGFAVLTCVIAATWLGPQSFAAADDLPERNIVFFITDDESPTLGCYGDSVAITPNVDALAKDGVLFRNAFATTASCSASRSVVMTGLHNHKNGLYGHTHDFHKFNAYHNVISLSLPRVLANEGYRTAQIGKYHVAPEAVFRFEKTFGEVNQRNPVLMAERCREFINNRDDQRPFFLYFGTSDPHRSGGIDKNSTLELKPNLFGNRPAQKSHKGIDEKFFDPQAVPVPDFLTDTAETREELAQYYQSCSRIDQGLGKLVEILKEAGVYDKTLIVFTSDHGMAFAGGKTTVYETGLHVPFVVRNPYDKRRGFETDAMISHVDITPSLLDFAGGLDSKTNGPKKWIDPDKFWKEQRLFGRDNRSGRNKFKSYQGKSWMPVLAGEASQHHQAIFASHTFHEITMYYPMRVVRDKKFKLIWNIAHGLDYPFATDLWVASSWQAQFRKGPDAMYGLKTVDQYIHRPKFELYDMENDPGESTNLADSPQHASVLKEYQLKLKSMQKELEDPWIMKWDYE